MHPFTFLIGIYMNFATIAREDGYIFVPDMTIDMLKVSNNDNLQGTIKFKDIYIRGLETLTVAMENFDVTEIGTPEAGNFDVCMKLPMDKMNITTRYVADIALGGKIPIYGEGNLSISLNDVVMDLCTIANYYEAYVDKMDLRMSYRYGPTSITGLYRHPHADRIGSELLDVANKMFSLWNSYEPEKASCVLSPVLQFVTNEVLHYERNSIEFNSTCLQESTFGAIRRSLKSLSFDILDIFQPRTASEPRNDFLNLLEYFSNN